MTSHSLSRSMRTPHASPWRSRRHLLALVAFVLALPANARPALAQGPIGRSSASVTSTTLVDFLWEATPSALTAIPRSRARCSPGECFSQFVATKANARWQVQVKLAAPPVGFTIGLSVPTRPASSTAMLSAVVWTPVYLTGVATPGQTAEVTFYGARVPGPGGRVPTVTDLSTLLQYRVVQRP